MKRHIFTIFFLPLSFVEWFFSFSSILIRQLLNHFYYLAFTWVYGKLSGQRSKINQYLIVSLSMPHNTYPQLSFKRTQCYYFLLKRCQSFYCPACLLANQHQSFFFFFLSFIHSIRPFIITDYYRYIYIYIFLKKIYKK